MLQLMVFVMLLVAGASSAAQTPRTPPPPEPMNLSAARGFGNLADVVADAPIYLLPDASRLPLRIASAGSQVRVLQQTGDWSNVQFQDPEFGLRTGYMQTRQLRMSAAAASDAQDSTAPRERPSPAARLSSSDGFFIGGQFEGTAIVPNDNTLSASTESGQGAGVVVGYGFSPRWALVGGLSLARMHSKDFDGTYGLSHFDIGTRIHFASPARRATPFLEAAVSGRAVSADIAAVDTHRLTASGPGVSFGGGVNVHVTPATAFTASLLWTVGNFTSYELDSVQVPGDAFGATSARVQVGLVWFARGGGK